MYEIAQIINIVGNENGIGINMKSIISAIQSQKFLEHPFICLIIYE
jgi:hypothetical protein